jgi:energy-coupling factor transporter transmembrane protein EcfT
MQENLGKNTGIYTTLPEKNKRSVDILFILILCCWLLLLYFYGGAKAPG